MMHSYNGPIMHNAGGGLQFDDAEMSRRLNQEAAKTVKYGTFLKKKLGNL
jgi:hypothetical protein